MMPEARWCTLQPMSMLCGTIIARSSGLTFAVEYVVFVPCRVLSSGGDVSDKTLRLPEANT